MSRLSRHLLAGVHRRDRYGRPSKAMSGRYAASLSRAISRCFDDGRTIGPDGATSFEESTLAPVVPVARDANDVEQCDVAVWNPSFDPSLYEDDSTTVAHIPSGVDATDVGADTHQVTVEPARTPAEPDQRTPRAAIPLAGATPVSESPAQAHVRRKLQQLVQDDELRADIASILGGQSVTPARVASGSAVTRGRPSESPRDASVNERAALQQAARDREAAVARGEFPPSPPSIEEIPKLKNEHLIFDKIAENMRYATAYDLGSLDLEQRFDNFDRAADRQASQTARARANPPRHNASELIAEAMDETPEMPPLEHVGDAAWPPRPANIRAYTPQERSSTFGQFEYEPDPSINGGDGVRILGDWESRNIVSVPIPQLVGKLVGGQPTTRNTIRFHQAGRDALIGVWRDWEAAGLLDRVITFDGSFVPRFIRGTQDRNPRPLSNHAWGTAFDINAHWNRLGAIPALVGEQGSVRELVEIANRNGFFWGGHFGGGRVDGMHFELGRPVA